MTGKTCCSVYVDLDGLRLLAAYLATFLRLPCRPGRPTQQLQLPVPRQQPLRVSRPVRLVPLRVPGLVRQHWDASGGLPCCCESQAAACKAQGRCRLGQSSCNCSKTDQRMAAVPQLNSVSSQTSGCSDRLSRVHHVGCKVLDPLQQDGHSHVGKCLTKRNGQRG